MLTFIDLFAGIGGFRIALEQIGAKCVFSSEIDPHARDMYTKNFGDVPYGDITKLNPDVIPDFDILCAGFPCQSFSISGKQKGFNDSIRGTLFFDISRILKAKKPKAFILENVQNLEKHDKGNTLFIMLKTLNELGYLVSYKILNAKDFGVPQNRERIIIIGSSENKIFDFSKLKMNSIVSMESFLDKKGDFEYLEESEYTILNEYKRQPKSGLIFIGYRNKKIRTVGVREGTEHLSRVHKQPNRIYSSEGVHPTFSSQETSGRYWIYTDSKVRKLTINECYRFMSFPENFIKIGTNAKLYERIGNSVCINMIKAVAEEIKQQFWGDKNNMLDEKIFFLEEQYKKAVNVKSLLSLNLNEDKIEWVKEIIEKEETLKGVFTVLVTSLVYKCLYPSQDIRRHQANMTGGYSGRSFDTKYITPFLKSKRFLGAMKESGWLTRSLEQNLPYDLNYPGKINDKKVKMAFLKILHDVEENNESPEKYLQAIFSESIRTKESKAIILVNPIEVESNITINEIITFLTRHFNYKYKSRGASILPVVALYSIYECIIEELKRFEGKYLEPLASHNSSDRSSGATGDITVRDLKTKDLYEVIEVKYGIPINKIMIEDAYKKFSTTKIQRYYLLSTIPVERNEQDKINKKIFEIKESHGCQVVVNGVLETLKYYLRLLKNTDNFINKYITNINESSEINYEHKLVWNNLINELKYIF